MNSGITTWTDLLQRAEKAEADLHTAQEELATARKAHQLWKDDVMPRLHTAQERAEGLEQRLREHERAYGDQVEKKIAANERYEVLKAAAKLTAERLREAKHNFPEYDFDEWADTLESAYTERDQSRNSNRTFSRSDE